MLRTTSHQPSVDEAVALLGRVLPRYTDQGVTLGLETYEQVSTADLLAVVRAVDRPGLGVCLDPGNCVARLETPEYVIGQVAPYVVNMHVKDFTFTRQEGWVGFSLTGCPLGTGPAGLRRHDPCGRHRRRAASARWSSTGCPVGPTSRKPAGPSGSGPATARPSSSAGRRARPGRVTRRPQSPDGDVITIQRQALSALLTWLAIPRRLS